MSRRFQEEDEMKRPLIEFAVFTLLLAGVGCQYIGKGVRGSGNRKTEKRELASFKSVEASGAFEVSIVCQQSQSFEMEGDDNILAIIKTEVADGNLRIHSETNYSPS